MQRSSLAIVLAAGEGTRMKSSVAKVLHPIAGRPMVAHVLAAAADAGIDAVSLVAGRDSEAVARAAEATGCAVETFVQAERLGTGHAVLSARRAIERGYDDILVLFGDTPLVRPETLSRARAALADGAEVAVIGFRAERPEGYGRLIEDDGALIAIREEKEASAEEKTIGFCNGGLMALSGHRALDLLDAIGNDNAKGEFYLTDVVEIARRAGGSAVAIEADAGELIGVNTRAELAEAEALWQRRRRDELMLSGVTMTAPETVFLSFDTEIGPDTVIEPNVFFGTGVTVGQGAVIHAFCHFEGRNRPGCRGWAVRAAAPRREAGRKVEGRQFLRGQEGGDRPGREDQPPELRRRCRDRREGECRRGYDHLQLRRREQAPDGDRRRHLHGLQHVAGRACADRVNAYIASGSVITEAVPDEALAFGRARQVNKERRASRDPGTQRGFQGGEGFRSPIGRMPGLAGGHACLRIDG